MAVRLVVACLHLCMLCFGAVANDTHACSTLFGQPRRQVLGRHFAGLEADAKDGADLGLYTMQPHWPESCATAFLDVLRQCARHHVQNKISDCANIAPAGTGTVAVSEALRPYLPDCTAFRPKSRFGQIRAQATPGLEARNAARGGGAGCVHHRHADFNAMTARQLGAKCVIMSVRDVVDRIASGYRWQLLERREKTAAVERKRGVEALNVNRYVTARLDGGRRPLGEAGRAGKFFSYAHVKYLHGLSAELCAKEAFEVHLLCTEHLTEELHRLGRVFTGQDIRARKSNSRSKEQPITWVAASRIDADLAARLRTLYREDDMIHEWVCSRYSSTQATPGQNSSASGTHLHARA